MLIKKNTINNAYKKNTINNGAQPPTIKYLLPS